MARKTNYDEKIAALEDKIAKKQEDMQQNNLSASEVLASIKG